MNPTTPNKPDSCPTEAGWYYWEGEPGTGFIPIEVRAVQRMAFGEEMGIVLEAGSTRERPSAMGGKWGPRIPTAEELAGNVLIARKTAVFLLAVCQNNVAKFTANIIRADEDKPHTIEGDAARWDAWQAWKSARMAAWSAAALNLRAALGVSTDMKVDIQFRPIRVSIEWPLPEPTPDIT